MQDLWVQSTCLQKGKLLVVIHTCSSRIKYTLTESGALPISAVTVIAQSGRRVAVVSAAAKGEWAYVRPEASLDTITLDGEDPRSENWNGSVLFWRQRGKLPFT